MSGREFQFEWDDVKAARNLRKHGISFDLARTVFGDPQIVTVADLEHSETEERWFSIGRASNGVMLSLVHVWSEFGQATSTIRMISARKATISEIREYQGTL